MQEVLGLLYRSEYTTPVDSKDSSVILTEKHSHVQFK